MTYVKDDDELLAASAKARQQIPALQKAFAAGFQPGEYLEVKAPFKTESGGTEWMWVEVTTWQGNRIGGPLDNEPEQVKDLHSGDHVEVRLEDVFDYIHTFPDNRTEGNTTTEVVERRGKAADKPKLPNILPAVPACDGQSSVADFHMFTFQMIIGEASGNGA